jgi:hypothetical protein
MSVLNKGASKLNTVRKQQLKTYISEEAITLEEVGWTVIEAINLNANMQELQEEAFDTVLAAREFQKHSLSRIEQIVKDDLNKLESKMTEMREVEVLFIDDLFKRGATGFEIKTMYLVINYRYLNHKPVLISSEYLVDKLLDIDEALGSRIREMSKDYLVEIAGNRKILNYRLSN